MEIKGKNIYLIEAKHSANHSLPSLGDIKDGLLKMILFTNLVDVKMDSKNYNAKPVLKLIIENHFDFKNLNVAQNKILGLLYKEAKTNGFEVTII